MKIEYIICDCCGASVAEETGAVVMRYTDESGPYPAMHLCNDCCDKLLTSPKKPQEVMEGGVE